MQTPEQTYTILDEIGSLNIENLVELARQGEILRNRIRIVPGMHMERVLGEPIDGVFGLQLVDLKGDTTTPVAHMGFNVKDNILQITQTPTGEVKERLSARLYRYLRNSNYHYKMGDLVLEVAELLGISEIQGYSMERHPTIMQKIENGEITPANAERSLNGFYESMGFERRWDDMYILKLAA